MSEFRLNRITGDWVIIASERARRPEDFVRKKEKREIPVHSPTCPFCPGNEGMSDAVLSRERNGRWDVRVVTNKFPAVRPESEKELKASGLKRWLSGVGYHEVVIETPEHNRWLWHQSPEEIQVVLESMRERYLKLLEDPRIELVVLFKNHGPSAGTSLEHPHAQIVATPVMPNDVRRRAQEALRFFDEMGQCLFCAMLSEELKDGQRIIHENPSFVSFVPFAAISPFHIWVFPRRHSPDFGSVSDVELADFAVHLRTLLGRIGRGLDNPDFNFVVRTLPVRGTDPRSFHWYLSIVPRVSQPAGFELGSGIYINPAIPEESAEFLRSVPEPQSKLV